MVEMVAQRGKTDAQSASGQDYTFLLFFNKATHEILVIMIYHMNYCQ